MLGMDVGSRRDFGVGLVFYLGVFLFCRVLRIGGPGALD